MRYIMLFVTSVAMYYILKGYSPALAVLTMLGGFSLPLLKISYRVAVIEDRRSEWEYYYEQ